MRKDWRFILSLRRACYFASYDTQISKVWSFSLGSLNISCLQWSILNSLSRWASSKDFTDASLSSLWSVNNTCYSAIIVDSWDWPSRIVVPTNKAGLCYRSVVVIRSADIRVIMERGSWSIDILNIQPISTCSTVHCSALVSWDVLSPQLWSYERVITYTDIKSVLYLLWIIELRIINIITSSKHLWSFLKFKY